MTLLGPFETAVTITGLVLIAFTLWFLRPVKWKAAAGARKSYQEILVNLARENFEPRTIVLSAGSPAKIRFQRIDGSEDWETFIVSGLSIERKLPAAKTTTVDIMSDEPGVFPFHSGVVRRDGVIVVTERN